MKKMIFDDTWPIDWKNILEMLIKDGESSLLSMPSFEIPQEKISDALMKYIKTISKPYVDETEDFLDENDLITNKNIMTNRFNDDGSIRGMWVDDCGTTYNTSNYKWINEIAPIPQNWYREWLKDLLWNKLSPQQMLNLQLVLEWINDEVRRTFAGRIWYIISQDMSARDWVERFNDILMESRIDLIQWAPDWLNINDSYWWGWEKILERLNCILEEK